MTASSTKLPACQVATAALIQQVRLAPGIPTGGNPHGFWLPPSLVMAMVEIESGFDNTRWGTPTWGSIKAADFETTGSVGLFQVSTAALSDLMTAWPRVALTPQTQPLASVTGGLLYLYLTWDRLGAQNLAIGTNLQWLIEGFNEGAAAARNKVPDPAYWIKVQSAQRGFDFLDD